MMNIKVIGIGAGGNKAVIRLIENNVVSKRNILLLNSTLKDIEDSYKEMTIPFGSTKGCGKERELAKDLTMEALQNGTINIDQWISKDTDMVVVVGTLEGGTGCGGTTIIGSYIHEVLGIPVHMFGFSGFEDDARGLKNTVDWFNDLNEEFTVEVISNSKYLEEANGNRSLAEKLANEDFVRKINVIIGNELVECENNIDDRDLYKLVVTPGYMVVETAKIPTIRDSESFDKVLKELIKNSKALKTEPSAKRIGFIFNGSPKTEQYIDRTFDVLKETYGYAPEIYQHFQHSDDEEFISIIISGLKLPMDEIKDVYDKFQKEINNADLTKDKFFKTVKKFDTSISSSLDAFSVKKPDINKTKMSFFKKDSKQTEEQPITAEADNKKSQFFNKAKNEI